MMAGILREHKATPRQQRLSFRTRRGRLPQVDLLLEKLREARSESRGLELPEIMALGIAQHGARLKEIRDRGFLVENELDHSSEGVVRSRYWLKFDPERDPPTQEEGR